MDPPDANNGSDWTGTRTWPDNESYLFNTSIIYECPIDYHIDNGSVHYLEQEVTCTWQRVWVPDTVRTKTFPLFLRVSD